MEKIKIVYNWIGPAGPIPNTEIPNILNIVAASKTATTKSQHFWSDSIWHSVFCNQPGYDLSPSTLLGHNDIFIYPYQLTWRLSFENYFYCSSGIFEYGETSEQTIHNVRSGKGFFLIEHSAEAHVERNHLTAIHTYFDYYRVPLNKVIYLTGCMNAEEIYNDFCMERGITHPTTKMIMVPYPVSQNSLACNYFPAHKPQMPEYDTERVPEKLFLSWNRRFRQHRISLALGLDKLGLLDRSYISMGKCDPENSEMTIFNGYNSYYLQKMNITENDINNLNNKLPLVLDGETNVNKMCQDFDDANRNFYQNSLVSIITETNYDAKAVSLTEKSFKPCKEKHPFITVGAPGTLAALRKMGFRTFSQFWDESYDLIANPMERLTKILEVCNNIASWDNNAIINFRRNVKPILDHNYETLKVNYSTVVATDIRNIIMSQLGIGNQSV